MNEYPWEKCYVAMSVALGQTAEVAIFHLPEENAELLQSWAATWQSSNRALKAKELAKALASIVSDIEQMGLL